MKLAAQWAAFFLCDVLWGNGTPIQCLVLANAHLLIVFYWTMFFYGWLTLLTGGSDEEIVQADP